MVIRSGDVILIGHTNPGYRMLRLEAPDGTILAEGICEIRRSGNATHYTWVNGRATWWGDKYSWRSLDETMKMGT